MTDLPAADQLLLYCARVNPDEEALARIKGLLQRPLNLKEVLDSPSFNSLAPLLYYNLQKLECQELVPPEVWAQFESLYYTSLLRNDRLYAELRLVLEALQAEGIDVILLKGAALAQTVYPNPALRPMIDLDILVSSRDVFEVKPVLEKIGYGLQPSPAGYPLIFDQRFGGELEFLKNEAPFPTLLDVHWHMTIIEWYRHSTGIDMDAIWAAARPLVIEGVPALQLSPEDTLIHLCLHPAVQHGYTFPVIAYVDIDWVVDSYAGDLDWELLVSRVSRFRVKTAVYFGLCFTRELLATPVPPAVLEALRPSGYRSKMVRWITSSEEMPVFKRPALGRRAIYLLQILLVDRFPDLLRMFFKIFFPGGEWLAARYSLNGSLIIGCYTLLHPLRVIWLGLSAFRELFSKPQAKPS